MKTRTLVVILFLSIFLNISCTEHREDQFAQGQGENNLILKDEIASWSHKIETQNEISKSNEYQVSKNLQNPKLKNKTSSQSQYNRFGYVKYKTDSPLLPIELNIKGRENFTYKLHYEISDRNLMIYKVGRAEDLPFDEIPSAKKFEGDLLAVPLLGYPLEYIQVVNQLDNNLRITHSLIEIPTAKDSATHLRFDPNKFEFFESEKEYKNLYPVGLFNHFDLDGKESLWYYGSTIVEGTGEAESYESLVTTIDSVGNNFLGLVRLKAYEDRIEVENAIADKSSQSRYGVDNHSLMTFRDIRFLDFATRKDGPKPELLQTEDNSRDWRQRDYVSIDFLKATTFYGAAPDKILKVYFDENYFTFLAMYSGLTPNTTKIVVRHAFRKKTKSNYRARKALDKDIQIFNLFTYRKPKSEVASGMKADEDENHLIMRHDPSKKVLKYYLEQNSDPDFDNEAQIAVDRINQGLDYVKVPLRIELVRKPGSKEYQRVAVGDIRYNRINMKSDFLYEVPFGGVASFLRDQDTGEIISSAFLTELAFTARTNRSYIQEFIKTKLIKFRKADKASGFGTLSAPVAANSSAQHYSNLFDFSHQQKLSRSNNGTTQKDHKRSPFHPTSGISCSHGSTNNLYYFKRVEKYCGSDSDADLGKIISKYKGQPISLNTNFSDPEDKEIIEKCANKLMRKFAVSTTVHELLHTLGLGHNFAGSNDEENFYSKEEIQNIFGIESNPENEYSSSSVMEYSRPTDYLVFPGKQDLATLAFLYKEAVLLEDMTKSKTLTDFETAAQDQVPSMRLFETCDDDLFRAKLDPMCLKGDRGSTPKEVVENLIAEFKDYFRRGRYRSGDFVDLDSNLLAKNLTPRFLLPLKSFYDQWRILLTQKVGLRNKYLTKYSKEKYEEIKNQILADTSKVGYHNRFTYQQWYEAADLARKFLFDELVLMNNRYCVFTQGERVKWLELDRVRNSHDGENIESCKHPVVAQVAGSTWDLIDDVGYELHNSFFNKRTLVDGQFDIAGAQQIRMDAMSILAIRSMGNPYFENVEELEHLEYKFDMDFFPNFFDEPDFREYAMNRLLDRIRYGAQVEVAGEKLRAFKFADEMDFYKRMFHVYLRGHTLPPGSAHKSEILMRPFRVKRLTSDGERMSAYLLVRYSIYREYFLKTYDSPMSWKLMYYFNQMDEFERGRLRSAEALTMDPFIPVIDLFLSEEQYDPGRITVSRFVSISDQYQEIADQYDVDSFGKTFRNQNQANSSDVQSSLTKDLKNHFKYLFTPVFGTGLMADLMNAKMQKQNELQQKANDLIDSDFFIEKYRLPRVGELVDPNRDYCGPEDHLNPSEIAQPPLAAENSGPQGPFNNAGPPQAMSGFPGMNYGSPMMPPREPPRMTAQMQEMIIQACQRKFMEEMRPRWMTMAHKQRLIDYGISEDQMLVLKKDFIQEHVEDYVRNHNQINEIHANGDEAELEELEGQKDLILELIQQMGWASSF